VSDNCFRSSSGDFVVNFRNLFAMLSDNFGRISPDCIACISNSLRSLCNFIFGFIHFINLIGIIRIIGVNNALFLINLALSFCNCNSINNYLSLMMCQRSNIHCVSALSQFKLLSFFLFVDCLKLLYLGAVTSCLGLSDCCIG